MARVETVRCDQCGVSKSVGDGKRWMNFTVCVDYSAAGNAIVINYPEPPGTGGTGRFKLHDICDEACFHKHLDALLFAGKKPTGGTFEIKSNGEFIERGTFEIPIRYDQANDD